MGGIAACLCMACGGNDSKDYWGDTSGGEDEEPTENPNAIIRCFVPRFVRSWEKKSIW